MDQNSPIELKPLISRLVGAGPVALPDESEEDFERDVALLQAEFNAYKPLERYLVEKLCERMWWLRRYESFKRQQIQRQGLLEWTDPVIKRPQEKRALQQIDERIALEFKLLAILQNMLERIQTRSIRRKKLALQVRVLERNINALELVDLA